MKLTDRLILSLFAALVLTACGHGSSGSSDGLFTDTLYAPGHAGGFVILGSADGSSSVISVRNPWQGADSVRQDLLILRNGESVPDGFSGQVIRGDASRIVTMSSTNIAMLDAISRIERVVGVSGIDYITNRRIQAGRDTIADVGYDDYVDYELLVSLDPDIVLLYGVAGASPMQAKLRELGIPYMYVGDYLEESPLGKAEWVVAVGELTGARAEAEIRFAGIDSAYNRIRARLSHLSDASRPSVMLNTPYGDAWFLPPSGSYMVRLIEDAGGRYVFEENNSSSSVAVDREQAYMLASQADVWLNVENVADVASLRAALPGFEAVPPLISGEVYSNKLRSTPGGGNDFFESGVMNPDLVLLDLVKILHPEIAGDYDFSYYKKLD